MANKISLIILAHNDSKTINKCVESVLNQSNIGEYELEILFVSNGCSDNTAKIGTESLQKNDRPNIKHNTYELTEGHRNKALNFGISKSTGKYIIYLNGDCYLANSSISLLTKELLSGSILVGCSDICLPDNTKKGSLLYKYIQAYGEGQKHSLYHLPNGRCIGFKNGLVDSFPEDIHSEDNWLGFTVYKKYGYEKIKKAGKVYYYLPNNWVDLISLLTRWSLGTKQILGKFPELNQAFIDLTTKEHSQKEKELGLIETKKALEKLGIGEEEMQKLFTIHRTIKTIVEDNTTLQKKLVRDDGTWTTDR